MGYTTTYQFLEYPKESHSLLVSGKIPETASEFYLETRSEAPELDPNDLRSLVHPKILEDNRLVTGLQEGKIKVSCTVVEKFDGVTVNTKTYILY
jgi:hypothetical protein